jgi:hypothetical protein
MLIHMAATLALALWFGGGVVAGLLAPQAAFSILTDRPLAGSIAGIVLSRFAALAVASTLVYVATWFLSRLTARP